MIDLTRSSSVFSASAFDHRRVAVIGVGNTGIKVVDTLARLGVQHINVYDFDTVDRPNIGPQLFNLADIGALKVDACYRNIKAATGTEVVRNA